MKMGQIVKPKIELIYWTTDIHKVIALNYKTCVEPDVCKDASKFTDEEAWQVTDTVMKGRHVTSLETINFGFSIEGVSRVHTHQLVRHKIGTSFNHQSQRAVRFEAYDIIVPPTIMKDQVALTYYLDLWKKSQEVAAALSHLGIPAEDARFSFLQGCTTQMIWTVNLRAFLDICKIRLNQDMQWEMRTVISLCAKEVIKHHPWLKPYIWNADKIEEWIDYTIK